ncbi:MAG: hypothetical protein K2M47_05185 [Clostridiales bacterium]|nr:hypothetical protein [Clostridiales bacterium]
MKSGNEPKNNKPNTEEYSDEVAAVEQSSQHILPIAPYLEKYLRRRLDGKDGDGQNAHEGHRKRLRNSAKNDVDLAGLSDVELVELLLSFFIPQKDTNVIAHRLIDRYGSVAGVLCAPQSELVNITHITAQAASMLPALFGLCLAGGQKSVRLKNRAEAADFFGIAYLGKLTVGTYAAFLDDEFTVRAIECYSADGVPMRDILSSACKHACKYVFIARREPNMFPQTYNIAAEVAELAGMLKDVNVTMLDYLIFGDYGYYTVGMPPRDKDWYPMYIFVPSVKYMRSPDMVGSIAAPDDYVLYAGRETAEPLPDFAKQLCDVLNDGDDAA